MADHDEASLGRARRLVKAGAGAALRPLLTRLANLATRLDSLEANLSQHQRVVGERQDAVEPRLENVAEQLDAIRAQMGSLEARLAAGELAVTTLQTTTDELYEAVVEQNAVARQARRAQGTNNSNPSSA